MALIVAEKDWDNYVVHAEEVARTPGFCELRKAILDRAAIQPGDRVVDVGAGTGLLTLPAAAVARTVWAVDVSRAMTEYLAAKARTAELTNVEPIVASAVSLPVVDESVDVAISNYCFHHLDDGEKLRALREVERVLVPGGRLVVGDMMFSLRIHGRRDRAVIAGKVRALLRKGPGGALRLAKNALRIASGRWERPAGPEWWRGALADVGMVDVSVVTLDHEGGIAVARKRGSE